MKIGIICATDRELAPFLPLIDDCRNSKKAMLTVYEGKLNKIDIVALYSGVCKVNAAIATQIAIDTYGADIIFNVGNAGGIDPMVEIGDTVISTETAYFDVDANILTGYHPYLESMTFKANSKLLELSRKAITNTLNKNKVYWGRMVTGESFIKDDGRDEIIAKFNPMTVDMETASVAHVCYVNSIPFLSIRSITDTAKYNGMNHYNENCDEASNIAKNVCVEIINEISNMLSSY